MWTGTQPNRATLPRTPLLPIQPSTMWTAAYAISAAQIGTRVSDDRNKPASEIRMPRGEPTSLIATKRGKIHPLDSLKKLITKTACVSSGRAP